MQEANTHQSKTDSGLFKFAKAQRRCGMAEGLSGLHRQGAKISVQMLLTWFCNLYQSHLYFLRLSFFFCKKVTIISTKLPGGLNKIIYAKHLIQ